MPHSIGGDSNNHFRIWERCKDIVVVVWGTTPVECGNSKSVNVPSSSKSCILEKLKERY
jgi:hypothetical protein